MAGFTVTQVLVGVVAAVVILWLLKAIFGGKTEDVSYNVPARCICGWLGMVSKFTRRCPKCNKSIQPVSFQ